MKKQGFKVAFLGNYLPRKCGIATFTYDLENAVNEQLRSDDSTFVVAMNNREEGYSYPGRVRRTIYQPLREEYREAAEFINNSDADVVSIQHEFGIFGGEGGEYIIEFLRHLRKPSIVTLHTVFQNPSRTYRRITKDMASLSHGLVVMSERAVGYLEDSYDIPARNIRMIHHGVPAMGFTDPDKHKSAFGFDGKTVLGTFGLLSRNKGIEHVINALPAVVAKHPDVLYVLLGETHPEIIKNSGEEYRESLLKLADDLGVRENVQFISKFLGLKDLVEFLAAVDIYITPYQSREQITSGTLAYSLAAGKPVISTPYWYAQELLDDGRGILVDFGHEDQISESILRLLQNDDERNSIREKAFKFGRRMAWPEVSRQYAEYFKEAKQERVVFQVPRTYSETNTRKIVEPIIVHIDGQPAPKHINNSLPRLNIGHLEILSDDTGIIQHAMYSVPDRKNGYCLDDNARALIATLKAQDFFPDTSNIRLIKSYLSYIHYSQLPDGRFHNFLNYERRFLDEVGSEDSFGRTIWALGYMIESAPRLGDIGMDTLARQIFEKAVPNSHRLLSPRAWAYSMLGFNHYLNRFPKDHRAAEFMLDFANRLMSLYRAFAGHDWRWFEPYVTYDNGRLPQSLYLAGEFLHDREYLRIAKETLGFLTENVFTNDIFMPIGTNGWWRKGESKALFDQQPIEGSSMIDAYLTAARSIYTPPAEARHYEILAKKVWNWFMGANIHGKSLFDPLTGACADGITNREISLNQGAESTICAIMSLEALRENLRFKTMQNIVESTKQVETQKPISEVV